MKTSVEKILVFDLETTGLSAEKHAICEIACCPMDSDLNDLPEYTSGIIRPYGDRLVDDRSLEANGITHQQLAEGRNSREVIDEFIKYLKSLKSTAAKIFLVGHNICAFDIPFLQDFFTFHGKELNKYVNLKFTMDTLWWARLKWTESVNYKLGTCCLNEKIELVDSHRALADTRSNKQLIRNFIKSLRGEGQTSQVQEVKKQRETFQI